MRRIEEIFDSNSCLNKADDDEPIFVLLARDRAAEHAVARWINARIELGLNSPSDDKLDEAAQWCIIAAQWRDQRRLGSSECPTGRIIVDSRTVTIQFNEIARLAGFFPGPDGRLNLPATQGTADALTRAASEILLPWMPGDAAVDVILTGAAPVWGYLMVAHGLHGTARSLSYAAPNAPVLRVWSHGSDT